MGQARDRVIFAGILLCAVVARGVGLLKHATMPDEAFTYFIASHDVPAIVMLLRTGDFHPPLVYLIGHVLLQLTSRAYLLRIVTLLFGVGGVAASYALARRFLGRWAPFAALLVALNPVLVFYDGFFRMYAMLWSLAMISWVVLLWALDVRQDWRRWLVYAVVLCALLYTQYLAFFTLAGQLAYVAIFSRRAWGFWISVVCSCAAFALWLPVFFAQYPLGGTAFNKFAGHLSALNVLPPVLLTDGLPPQLEYSAVTIIAMWLVVAGGIVIAIRQRQWTLLALLGPIVLQVGYSLGSGKLLLGQRYLLQAIPPLVFICVLFLAWVAITKLRPLALASVASLGLMTLAGTVDKHFLAPFMPVDWTTYGKFLSEKIQPGDGVVFDGSMTYYVLVATPVTSNRPLFLITNAKEAAKYGSAAARLPRVWYVGYQSDLPDPDHLVLKALIASHPKTTSWRTTDAGYGDVVFTSFFDRPVARAPAVRSP